MRQNHTLGEKFPRGDTRRARGCTIAGMTPHADYLRELFRACPHANFVEFRGHDTKLTDAQTAVGLAGRRPATKAAIPMPPLIPGALAGDRFGPLAAGDRGEALGHMAISAFQAWQQVSTIAA